MQTFDSNEDSLHVTPTLQIHQKLTNKTNLFPFYNKQKSHRIQNEQTIEPNMSSVINNNEWIVGKSVNYLYNSLELW